MDDLRKAISKKVAEMIPEQLMLCTVTEVDESALTCTCQTVNEGIDIYDVSLTPVIDQEASEVITIPAINSPALVAIIQNDLRNTYLVSCQKADKVFLRGTSLGGLVKVKELRKQLDKTTKLLQAIVNTINGTAALEPGNGAASVLQATLKAAIAGKELGSWDDIENERVQHG